MRLTVLGGTGGWPAAGTACSGYLVERDGYLVLIDPGYATFPRLLEHCAAAAGARGLLLTHLMPGTDPGDSVGAASAGYGGEVAVAVPGLTRLLP